jgi:hypothetical protein
MAVQFHDVGDGAGDVVRATTLVGQVNVMDDGRLMAKVVEASLATTGISGRRGWPDFLL